jgi:hypothetical protein
VGQGEEGEKWSEDRMLFRSRDHEIFNCLQWLLIDSIDGQSRLQQTSRIGYLTPLAQHRSTKIELLSHRRQLACHKYSSAFRIESLPFLR